MGLVVVAAVAVVVVVTVVVVVVVVVVFDVPRALSTLATRLRRCESRVRRPDRSDSPDLLPPL